MEATLREVQMSSALSTTVINFNMKTHCMLRWKTYRIYYIEYMVVFTVLVDVEQISACSTVPHYALVRLAACISVFFPSVGLDLKLWLQGGSA